MTLQERVEAALEKDQRTAGAAIEVIDENGVVTLKGAVASIEIREAAQEIAEQEKGALEVINDLTLEGEEEGLKGPPFPPIRTR